MTNILVILILSALWCFGVRALFMKGKLLEKAGIWMDSNLPLWVNQPLWRCPPCMSSFHGILIYSTFLMGIYGPIWLFPFIVMLCGLNYITSYILIE